MIGQTSKLKIFSGNEMKNLSSYSKVGRKRRDFHLQTQYKNYKKNSGKKNNYDDSTLHGSTLSSGLSNANLLT